MDLPGAPVRPRQTHTTDQISILPETDRWSDYMPLYQPSAIHDLKFPGVNQQKRDLRCYTNYLIGVTPLTKLYKSDCLGETTERRRIIVRTWRDSEIRQLLASSGETVADQSQVIKNVTIAPDRSISK